MDELNNKGYNGENGTEYEKAGVDRLEKGFDSENGTPYEQAGGNPFGDNPFSSAEGSTQHQFGSYPRNENFDNIGQHKGQPPKSEPLQPDMSNGRKMDYSSMNSYAPRNNSNNYYQQNAQPYNNYNQQNNQPYGGQQYGNQYNQPYNNVNYQYGQTAVMSPYQQQESPAMAIIAFVMAMINLIFFRSFLSVLTVPICLILAIIALAKKKPGKGFAISSIVVSVISAIIFGSLIAVFVRLYPDMKYFIENEEQIIADFQEDGTLPEQFDKYDSPKFKKYWKAMGCDNFREFFKLFIQMYREQTGSDPFYDYGGDDEEEDFPEEESPITA